MKAARLLSLHLYVKKVRILFGDKKRHDLHSGGRGTFADPPLLSEILLHCLIPEAEGEEKSEREGEFFIVPNLMSEHISPDKSAAPAVATDHIQLNEEGRDTKILWDPNAAELMVRLLN